jgi:hypothetical protein
MSGFSFSGGRGNLKKPGGCAVAKTAAKDLLRSGLRCAMKD